MKSLAKSHQNTSSFCVKCALSLCAAKKGLLIRKSNSLCKGASAATDLFSLHIRTLFNMWLISLRCSKNLQRRANIK
jgi:hypothetical protein